MASKVTGFIRPPPGVREVVEKTAAFVARGGPEFEAKIKSSDSSGKFAFLSPDHPYHAYYKHKIAELQQHHQAGASSSSAAPTAALSKPEAEEKARDEQQAAPSPTGSAAGMDASTSGEEPRAKDGAKRAIPPVLEVLHPLAKAIKLLQSQARSLQALQQRIRQQQQQGQGQEQGGRDGEQAMPEDKGGAAAASASASPLDSISSIVASLPPPPPHDHFSPPHPSYLTPAEIEVIKLTAQFTAAQGKTFLLALQARESEAIKLAQQQVAAARAAVAEASATNNNSLGGGAVPAAAATATTTLASSTATATATTTTFDFLKPSHPAFSYFTSLVDQYHAILQPPPQLIRKLKADAGFGTSAAAAATATPTTTKGALLARCVHRMEARRLAEEKRREKEAAMRGDLSAGMAAGSTLIDWQDFVVVGTISFDDDDDAGDGDTAGGGRRADSSSASSLSQQGVAVTGKGGASINSSDSSSNMFIAAAAERINIRTDYQPLPLAAAAAAAMGAGAVGGGVVIDPRTGQSIPLEQASEHLRINLLDPKWKQQRDLHLARQSETLYAPGEQVAANLKALASKRGDVFASERDRDSEALGPPLAKRPRLMATEQQEQVGGGEGEGRNH